MFILPKKWRHKAIQDKKKGSLIQIFKIPGVTIVVICTLTGGILISFFDLTIAVLLDQVTDGKITRGQIGAFFLFSTAFYAVSAPVWG